MSHNFFDEDLSWRQCFQAPLKEEDLTEQGTFKRKATNDEEDPKTAAFLKSFGLDESSSYSSQKPIRNAKRRRFPFSRNCSEQDPLTSDSNQEKTISGSKEIASNTHPFRANIYFLLAKYGKVITTVSDDAFQKREDRQLLRDVRRWWGCENDWTLTSVSQDFSPWKMSNGEIKENWAKLIDNECRLDNAVLASKRDALDDEDFLETEWEEYNIERMLTWQKRALDLNGAVPSALLGSGVQLFEWSNNSCAYDAMLSAIPELCNLALQNGLYAAHGKAFSYTVAARMVAILLKLSKEKSSDSRRRICAWLRHFAQDAYELDMNKKVKEDAEWKVYKQNEFREMNEVLEMFAVLMGRSYTYKSIPAINVHTSIILATPEALFAHRTGCESLAGLIYHMLKEREELELESGLYIVQLSDLIHDKRTGRLRPTKSNHYKDFASFLRRNQSFSFEKDLVRFRAEICAHFGFKDKSYDHFVSAFRKGSNAILYHDSLANRGRTKRYTPSQVYSDSRPLIVIPSSKVVLIVAREVCDTAC